MALSTTLSSVDDIEQRLLLAPPMGGGDIVMGLDCVERLGRNGAMGEADKGTDVGYDSDGGGVERLCDRS